eukprot:TRINITY_DN8785_c0_g2_i1.p1 TRINITY_DN8785_c0_g2~~TRINITY_DN8785_c0_g2_i1.p1  ORF type:complete len:515 (+),score=72.61 TRINITY_DN8785_c0_g2_i1:636-2180(+)
MAQTSYSHSSFNPSSSVSNDSCRSASEQGGISTEHIVENHLSSPEIVALRKLGENISSLLSNDFQDFCDAEIVVEDKHIGVHRCILAARSRFLKEKFFRGEQARNGNKVKYDLKEWLKVGYVGYDAFMILLNYLYSGEVKAPPTEVCTCADQSCRHDVCRPAIDFAVELLYAAHALEIPELVSLSQRRLQCFVDTADVEDVIPILVAANACDSGKHNLQSMCVERVGRSNVDKVSLEKELPRDLLKQINMYRPSQEIDNCANSSLAKSIERIHRALDSDDVPLVSMLLQEGQGTIHLDDALALHYAAAYCDPKITTELLRTLSTYVKDVNAKNSRGYTALHIAARRREPMIIQALLNHGVNVSDKTSNNRTALQIAKRLTKDKDFWQGTVEGKKPSKEKQCIELLENKEKGFSCFNHFLYHIPEDIHTELLDLEHRVCLAKLMFPKEATYAMEIAKVNQTEEYIVSRTTVDGNNVRVPDCNLWPEKCLERLEALRNTGDFAFMPLSSILSFPVW